MRWKHSLLPRLLAPYVTVVVAVAISLYAYGNRVVEQLYLDTLSAMTGRQARLVGQLVPWDASGPALDRRSAALAAEVGARITIIAADGVVLGDSDAPSTGLENHSDRPEVRAALQGGEGYATRNSVSVGRSLFYAAWRQRRDGQARIVRLAVPMSTVDGARRRIRAATWGGVALAALAAWWPALLIAQRLSRRVDRITEYARAVATGQQPTPLLPVGRDVMSRLEANLDALATSLSRQLHSARDEQEKLAGVLRGMTEGILVVDLRGIILLSNQAADRLCELPVAESVGRPLVDVSGQPELRALVRQVLREGTATAPAERELVLAGDRPRILQATVTPLAAEDGAVRAFILVCRDVTALKQLEQSRRDFVANVSHELRTPLAAIRGYSETLLDGALEDKRNARRFVGIIERHAERLGRLVDDLLTLSDLELGRTQLRCEPVSPAHVIESACEVLRVRAQEAQVSLVQQAAAELPELEADSDRLVQMLVNLIDNAVKYTPAGGCVTVGAQAARAEDGRSGVEVFVADDGIGISAADLPRLTERFYRVDKARSRELGGTGLGLAIVKHIVQAHGGTLSIESRINQGTTVRVWLRAARTTSL